MQLLTGKKFGNSLAFKNYFVFIPDNGLYCSNYLKLFILLSNTYPESQSTLTTIITRDINSSSF